MVAISIRGLTFSDILSHTDRSSSVDPVMEGMFIKTNEMLQEMIFVEATGCIDHVTTVSSDCLNDVKDDLGHVQQPGKSGVVRIVHSIGTLEIAAKVDSKLASLNNNSTIWRLSEEVPFITSLSNEMVKTIIYGDSSVDLGQFTGLAKQYSSFSAKTGPNIIDGGGRSNNNTSIWLIVWSSNTCHGIYPKGSRGGISMEDLGEEITQYDEASCEQPCYTRHYKWQLGLILRNWRYAVRIANIDISAINSNVSARVDLIALMTQAIEKIPHLNLGKPVFYCNRAIGTMLRLQIPKDNNINLTFETVAGKQVVAFDAIPVRKIEVISSNEECVR